MALSKKKCGHSFDEITDQEASYEASKKIQHFGIGYELFKNMKKFQNFIAQFNYEADSEDTYEALLQRSIRTALKLRTKNFDNDAIVGICAKNHSNSSVSYIAAMFLGHTTLTLDGSISSNDASFLIKQVTPTILFIDEEFVPMMHEAIKKSGENFEMVVFGKSDNHSSFDEYLEITEGENDFEPIKINDLKRTASILLSSGSTGLSKGICLSHGGLLEQAYYYTNSLNISSNSVLYYFTTLNWVSSVIVLICATLTGAARVNNAIASAWQVIDKYKVTNMNMSPYFASCLTSQERPDGVSTDSVKTLITAGTKLNPVLRSKLEENFPTALISSSYGLTEASGWVTWFQYSRDEDHILALKKPDSGGKIISGFSYRIVDRETEKDLGPNKVGELRLKSTTMMMNGHYKQDSSNEFDSEGWLKTGDLMYYDEDECFYVVGRCKELLKYRGFHIQPQMLEQILESHPAVNKAIVLGITHEIDGDHPIGLVTLNEEHKQVSPKELELFVEGQVQERQRLRKGVKIIKDIPFTATGKPRRFLLKQWLQEGKI